MIDVRITLPLNILRNSGLLLHAKLCSGAIVRFSDRSSFVLKMMSAFYICYIYSSALQTKFFMVANNMDPGQTALN